MALSAHIGNVPVEESLAFLVPVVALYLYGRHWHRRRRKAITMLPAVGEPLDDTTLALVAAEWAKANHAEVSGEHLPLLYPPGPDGASAAELASKIHRDPADVQRLLDDLQELGYLDLEERAPHSGTRAWLTDHGYDLVHVTEDALVGSVALARADRSLTPSSDAGVELK